MRKKFVRVMFLGTLTLATTMSFVGCKDYDDDIDAINERLDTNDATLTAIQEKLKSGEWVQKVEPITNGIRVTLGNGNYYDILNGEKGQDGTNGKNGTVYEIGEDGYWYQVKEDGGKEKTDWYALAHDPKIEDGYWMVWDAAKGEYVKTIAAQGSAGGDGTNGKDGHSPYINESNNNWMVWDAAENDGKGGFKDSGICAKGNNGTDIWYEPNADTKTWWKHEGDKATDTEISYLAEGTITAIKNDEGKIVLYGIPGYDEGFMLVNSRTLNSLTLIPRLFIDGIPAIDFRTLKYTPQVFDKTSGTLKDQPGKSPLTVDNGATTIYYQLSPANLTKDDIALPHFISNKNVEVRADMGEVDDLITAKDYVVEGKGRLKVTVNKVAGGSLELGEGKINMVAAQVASSEAVLKVTGKEENVITSEYTRLAETSFTPSIAALTKATNGWEDWKTAKYDCENAHNHYADYKTAYAYKVGEGIASELNYKSEEPLDLRLLVTGCYMSGEGDDAKAKEITTEELKAYGLAFRFAIPTDAYVLGEAGTNQQAFAKLDGYRLTSQLPKGTTDMRAAIDKEPIICVMLQDTVNNNLVDQRYFKVKFAEKAQVVNPIDCGEIKTFTEALDCGEYTMSVDWETITNKVYGHEDINMSKDEFTKIYTELKVVSAGTGNAELLAENDPEQGTTVLKWTIDNKDVTIAPALSKDFTINLKYVDPTGKNGDVTFSLKATISIDKAPALIGIVKNYWLDNTDAAPIYYPVYPVHYDVDGGTGQVCTYANPLINAFNKDAAGKFVQNIGLSCAGWDIQFALTGQPAGYAPDYTGTAPALANGWKLVKGGDNLVWLEWAGNQWGATEPVIHLKRAGQDLLTDLEIVQAKETAKYKNVKATVWGKANDANNYYKVKDFNFVFVNPLAIKADIKGAFEDGIYSGSRVAIADAFTMVDFRGYTVAENAIVGATEEKEKYANKLYTYYGVEAPVWDLAMGNVKVSMRKDDQGNTIVDNTLTPNDTRCLTLEEVCGADASLTFDEKTNELVFKNAKGSDTQEEYTMYVKASIKHFWGVAERIAAIKVYPNGKKPAGK